MGSSRRKRIILPIRFGRTIGSLILPLILALALASCTGGSPDAEDLLLGHGDFPSGEVTESNPLSTVTPQGVAAVQVDLAGPDFTLSQSIVVFQTQASALSVLSGIQQDQITRVVLPSDTSRFEDATGILTETRGGQDFFTQFFVQGLALVKVTVTGPEATELLPVFAEMARVKVSRR
ncbi:MAG: hypothetical protein BZY81_03655 [SAR202 cluster bacterium Io17-Chloro-G4]|nr:MAG: hypothetical protein BZY81_03655 [SAR202 cluster bacterium Io17-Chloro-G4]